MHQHSCWRCGRGPTAAVTVMLAAVFCCPAISRADTAAPLAASANLVPSNAAFYTSMLRNREQLMALLQSRAWAKLRSLPAVKDLTAKMLSEMAKQGHPQQAAAFFAQPQNQRLLRLLSDMGADEIFIYGGQSWIEIFHLLSEFSGFGSQIAMMGPNANPKQAQAMLFKAIMKNGKRFKVPSLVIGFKVSSAEAANEQLARLEQLLRGLVQQQPMLKGRLRRTPVGGSRFLTLNLDGSLIPWDQMNLQDYEEEAGQADELVKTLKAKTLVVALGVHKDYVLLSIGDSTKPVAVLGEGEHLMQRPEFKPAEQFAGKPITSLSYVSKAFMSAISTTKKDVDKMVAQLQSAINNLPLADDQKKQMSNDLVELGRDMKTFVAEPGANVSVSFLNGHGQESYDYDYGQHPGLDGSKPLTLLQHAGGSPILAVAGRGRYEPKKYELLVKWVKKAYGYVDNFVVGFLNDEQKAQIDQVTKVVFPLLERFDKATRTQILPAFKDSQFAFVLDAGIRSKRWFPNFQTPTAMPMLEPAIVFGISNAEALRKGVEEYRLIINDAIAKARDFSPQKIQEFEIPPPETRPLQNGTMYYYNLPPVGLDPQILPNAALSQHVLALTLSPRQSEAILSRTPLKVEHGLLADAATRPLAMAAYFNWPALLNAARPWVHFGVRAAIKQSANENGSKMGAEQIKSIMSQVDTVLDILKVLRNVQSVSYFEGKMLVTHTVTTVRDIPQ